MQLVRARSLTLLMVLSCWVNAESLSLAQNGNSEPTAPETRLAIGGYCAVCVHEMHDWIKGSPKHTLDHDGLTYFFAGHKQKVKFLADPDKYAPVLSGDCVVCQSRMNRRIPGSVRNAVFHRERLYLFPDQQQKEMFKDNPEAYTKVDLALDGNCAVCQREMNKQVAGKPEVMTVHRGLRYFFPSEKQRKTFLSNPEKYEAKPPVVRDKSTSVLR